uniref:Uncharacterized protein n=1 Tax=Steinernema glaseri TaxID=37863 RepID=A0A1I7Y8S0_9BILA
MLHTFVAMRNLDIASQRSLHHSENLGYCSDAPNSAHWSRPEFLVGKLAQLSMFTMLQIRLKTKGSFKTTAEEKTINSEFAPYIQFHVALDCATLPMIASVSKRMVILGRHMERRQEEAWPLCSFGPKAPPSDAIPSDSTRTRVSRGRQTCEVWSQMLHNLCSRDDSASRQDHVVSVGQTFVK